MNDLLAKCTQFIEDAIADQVYELGGTEHDVKRIARSAALMVFTWSACESINS